MTFCPKSEAGARLSPTVTSKQVRSRNENLPYLSLPDWGRSYAFVVHQICNGTVAQERHSWQAIHACDVAGIGEVVGMGSLTP